MCIRDSFYVTTLILQMFHSFIFPEKILLHFFFCLKAFDNRKSLKNVSYNTHKLTVDVYKRQLYLNTCLPITVSEDLKILVRNITFHMN